MRSPPSSSLDHDGLLFRKLLLRFRESDLQLAIVIACLDVFFSHVLSHIEAPGEGAAVAFLPDHIAFVILLILARVVGCAHIQIAVIQFQMDVFLLAARQFHIQHVASIFLCDIGLHGHITAVCEER